MSYKQSVDTPYDKLTAYRARLDVVKKGLKLKVVRRRLESPESSDQSGSGLIYNSMDELVNQLHLKIGSRDAGNTSVELKNDIVEILDILLRNKVISNSQHKDIFSSI